MPVPAVQNDEPNVARLIVEARMGSVEALGGLYERFAQRVLRTAYRITRSRPDAEDILHDVFLHLPESLACYEERQRFDAWISVLTVRCALGAHRRDRRREELLARAPVDDRSEEPLAGDEDLQRAVARLPESLHRVLVLKQIEGYSHEQVASLLGITPGASRMRFARALKLLRHALRGAP